MVDGNEPKPRVNGSLLREFHGKMVCLLGMAHDVDQRGTSFKMTASDRDEVTVRLQEPLQEYVQGLTEVYGEVGPNNEVLAHAYVQFPPEISQNFNLEQYDKAVTFMNKFSDHYIQGVQSS